MKLWNKVIVKRGMFYFLKDNNNNNNKGLRHWNTKTSRTLLWKPHPALPEARSERTWPCHVTCGGNNKGVCAAKTSTLGPLSPDHIHGRSHISGWRKACLCVFYLLHNQAQQGHNKAEDWFEALLSKEKMYDLKDYIVYITHEIFH